MYFQALDNLIHILATLPGIGRRSAARIAFHLIQNDDRYSVELSRAIQELKEQVRFCSVCGSLSDQELCEVCSDPSRENQSICVVEEPGDVFSIENTGEFHGRYHVLMGVLSPLDGIGPGDIRLKELVERTAAEEIREIIVATNPTMEGDATAHYIGELLKNTDISITRISHGISTGGSIEFADRAALARSIKNRREL